MLVNVFAYGTLMFPEVVREVAGIRGDGGSAVLTGFRRRTVQIPNRIRGLFPAVVPSPEGRVEGVLFRDVNNRQLAEFDEFEELALGSYVREQHPVQMGSEFHEAFVYVCGPRLTRFLSGDWNPETFRREELDWYLTHFVEPYAVSGHKGDVRET